MSLLYDIQGNNIVPKFDPVTFIHYKSFLENVVDSKIPILKPIGFKITNASSGIVSSKLNKNTDCTESIVTISSRIRELIFLGKPNDYVRTEACEGDIFSDIGMVSGETTLIEALDPNLCLCTALEGIVLTFFVKRQSGIGTMEENARCIRESQARLGIQSGVSFFPLHTYHTLNTHVMVLPFTEGDSTFRVRYARGMTAERFDRILTEGDM